MNPEPISLIAIRPEPGLSATVRAGREMGLAIRPHPLSQVEALDWECPDARQFDGLLIGSANAIRHGGNGLANLRHLPVLAVGRSTAKAAIEAGFTIEKVGEGGLRTLLDGMADGPRCLLRLAGEDRIKLRPPPHIAIDTCIVYRVAHRPFSSEMVSDLQGKSLVLLHSARASANFASECDRLAIARSEVALAAIGPRVLEAAGGGWRDARSANQPNDLSLLALARYMCH